MGIRHGNAREHGDKRGVGSGGTVGERERDWVEGIVLPNCNRFKQVQANKCNWCFKPQNRSAFPALHSNPVCHWWSAAGARSARFLIMVNFHKYDPHKHVRRAREGNILGQSGCKRFNKLRGSIKRTGRVCLFTSTQQRIKKGGSFTTRPLRDRRP